MHGFPYGTGFNLPKARARLTAENGMCPYFLRVCSRFLLGSLYLVSQMSFFGKFSPLAVEVACSKRAQHALQDK